MHKQILVIHHISTLISSPNNHHLSYQITDVMVETWSQDRYIIYDYKNNRLCISDNKLSNIYPN